MATDALEDQRLAIDRERLELDKARVALERRFVARHFGALLTATVALAAVLVSATQIWVARITSEKELGTNSRQKMAELRLKEAELEKEMELRLVEFVAQHQDAIFTTDSPESVRIQNLIVAVFPPRLTTELYRRLAETAPTDARELFKKGHKLAASLSDGLFLQVRSLEVQRIGDLIAGNKSPLRVLVSVNGSRVGQNDTLDIYRMRNREPRTFEAWQVRSILGDFAPDFEPFQLTVELIDIDDTKPDRSHPVLGRFQSTVDPSMIGKTLRPPGEDVEHYGASNAKISLQLGWQ